ncbi:ChaN family lipoprotein [Hydrogenophaga laconesensis]|uniref:Iron-regulated protein n=1 Tax=Hydrogenophaga laconesensis TaxID=1805971 RepID=A0ABU1V7M2_9BURK|nr:ChaN family lipoprotein [Hydrogenophaga laconesensis]MDR7093420.1 putative iron-regulated protein [Hydrogenophaga laconesensis]
MTLRLSAVLALVALLAACAHRPPATVPALLDRVLPTPVLMLGEQHDAAEHQALQRDVVEALARRDQLAALVMEMIEQGRSTQGLPSDANEQRVREALAWTDQGGWPWSIYGPVVMAAVRSGVPVIGGNLPRAQMRNAMGDAVLDDSVSSSVLQRQRDAIRESHCNLLPESQIAPMTRIQLARDKTLAQTAVQAVIPGKTVVLVAGNGHVKRDLGVPLHLPAGVDHKVVMAQAGSAAEAAAPTADAVWTTPALAPRDHCAELKQQMQKR